MLTPAVAIEWSSKQIVDWRGAKEAIALSCETGRSNQRSNAKWSAPANGSLKLNVDASVYAGASSFSIGMVLRDDKGRFVRGKCMNVKGTVSVFEAESFGVCEALSWIMQEVNQPVSIESDSLQTVNALNKKVHYQLEVGDILDRCRILVHSNSCSQQE